MVYKIIWERDIESVLTFKPSEDDNIDTPGTFVRKPGAEVQTRKESIADLVLRSEECLVWLLTDDMGQNLFNRPEEARQHELQRLPLAANYCGTSIGNSILVQDPLNQKGPYILDRDENPDDKIFVRRNLLFSGSDIKIVAAHRAGDIIPDQRFFYIGDPQEMFKELEARGYSFKE